VADDQARKADQTEGGAAPSKPVKTTEGVKRPVIKKRVGTKKRREEIEQPDEFIEKGTTIVDWVVENGKLVGSVVGVILAALLIYGVMQRVDEGTREGAAEALFEARKKLPDSGAPIAVSPVSAKSPEELKAEVDEAVAALDAVATEHEGTPQARVAHLEAGAALYRSDRFEESISHFEAAESGGGSIGLLASGSKAAALESLGRHDEAIVGYEAVRSKASGQMKEQAIIDLARVYTAKGDTAKAKELYTTFETDFPDSAMLPEVQAKASALAAL